MESKEVLGENVVLNKEATFKVLVDDENNFWSLSVVLKCIAERTNTTNYAIVKKKTISFSHKELMEIDEKELLNQVLLEAQKIEEEAITEMNKKISIMEEIEKALRERGYEIYLAKDKLY